MFYNIEILFHTSFNNKNVLKIKKDAFEFLSESPNKNIIFKTYFNEEPRSCSMYKMDSSIAIGYYVKNFEEFHKLY